MCLCAHVCRFLSFFGILDAVQPKVMPLNLSRVFAMRICTPARPAPGIFTSVTRAKLRPKAGWAGIRSLCHPHRVFQPAPSSRINVKSHFCTIRFHRTNTRKGFYPSAHTPWQRQRRRHFGRADFTIYSLFCLNAGCSRRFQRSRSLTDDRGYDSSAFWYIRCDMMATFGEKSTCRSQWNMKN